jgi:hypothetical protein
MTGIVSNIKNYIDNLNTAVITTEDDQYNIFFDYRENVNENIKYKFIIHKSGLAEQFRAVQ